MNIFIEVSARYSLLNDRRLIIPAILSNFLTLHEREREKERLIFVKIFVKMEKLEINKIFHFLRYVDFLDFIKFLILKQKNVAREDELERSRQGIGIFQLTRNGYFVQIHFSTENERNDAPSNAMCVTFFIIVVNHRPETNNE